MILDDFDLYKSIIQIQYAEAFELWDSAGAISRQICNIWPGLTLANAQPQEQSLTGEGVQIQTGIKKSTINLQGKKSLAQGNIHKIKDTFQIWRESLDLRDLKRVSTRATYVLEFSSIKEANNYLLALNLVRWPSAKVFDQSMEADLNGFELLYRFEDEKSFSVLRLKTEQIELRVDLDPYFTEEPEIRKQKNRFIIDFDRGLLGSVDANKFRMDDWIKGFQHILRRDIEKIIKSI